jgi:hypothetical protein
LIFATVALLVSQSGLAQTVDEKCRPDLKRVLEDRGNGSLTETLGNPSFQVYGVFLAALRTLEDPKHKMGPTSYATLQREIPSVVKALRDPYCGAYAQEILKSLPHEH